MVSPFFDEKLKVREVKYLAYVKGSKAELKIVCWTLEPTLASLFYTISGAGQGYHKLFKHQVA